MSADFPTIRPTPAEDPSQPGFKMRPTGFQISEELEAVATRLIDSVTRLGFLEEHNLAYLFNWDGPPNEVTVDSVGKAKKITGFHQALTPHRGALIVDAATWHVLAEQAQEALVLHHLCHFGENEKTGALEIVGHDVEEFLLVAATYGKWTPRLRDFAEQLDLRLER